MPKSPKLYPQEFAFQSTDQPLGGSLGLGGVARGAEGTPQHLNLQPYTQRYATGQPLLLPDGDTTPATGPCISSPNIGAHQSQQNWIPPQQSEFNLGANTVKTTEYLNHYQPQGELIEELQKQSQLAATNEFSTPHPIHNLGAVYQALGPFSPPPKLSQRHSYAAGMSATKRKADSESQPSLIRTGSAPMVPDQYPSKRPNTSRASSNASAISPTTPAIANTESLPQASGTNIILDAQRQNGNGKMAGINPPRKVPETAAGKEILPAGKVFPIQIGSELFRLSGASISSDAPSYFSHFFDEQLQNTQRRAGDVRTLYIDRDPETFRDIAAHLQGYYITPKDGEHFVRLFADAQFYSLPRLTKQLFKTDIFIRIGGVPFQIPRDLFSSPGDTPNYFSLGFAQFFSTPSEVFPGLDRNVLLRPPSIIPPSVPHRSGETFRELVKILQGYPVEIRSDEHRAELLRDARYFYLKGLEQKLIACEISYNLRRKQSEILIRLEDIRQSGITFTPDLTANSMPLAFGSDLQTGGALQPTSGTVSYARPYTEDKANVLILETSSAESTMIHYPIDDVLRLPESLASLNLQATFDGSTLARITSLFAVVASKLNLPPTQFSQPLTHDSPPGWTIPADEPQRVRIRIPDDCYFTIDSQSAEPAFNEMSGHPGFQQVSTGRRYTVEDFFGGNDAKDWLWGGARVLDSEEHPLLVKRAQWRVRVESVYNSDDIPADEEEARRNMRVVLEGVRIEASSGERRRNAERGFLGRP